MRNRYDGGVCSASRFSTPTSDAHQVPGATPRAAIHSWACSAMVVRYRAWLRRRPWRRRRLRVHSSYGDGLISSHLDTPYRSHSGHLCSVSSVPSGSIRCKIRARNFRLLGCVRGRLFLPCRQRLPSARAVHRRRVPLPRGDRRAAQDRCRIRQRAELDSFQPQSRGADGRALRLPQA